MHVERFADLGADAAEGVERAQRVLQHEGEAATADAAPLALREAPEVDVAPAEALGLDGRAGTGDAEQGPGRHALARTGLADDRDALPGADVERDAAHGVDVAGAPGEGDGQVADAEHRRLPGALSGTAAAVAGATTGGASVSVMRDLPGG